MFVDYVDSVDVLHLDYGINVTQPAFASSIIARMNCETLGMNTTVSLLWRDSYQA